MLLRIHFSPCFIELKFSRGTDRQKEKLHSIRKACFGNRCGVEAGPLPLLPSILPSIRLFSSESALRIRWSKYWSLSVSISPSSEYSGLISFRIDWFDFAVQGTLKSFLQYHSSKASILWCSAFFGLYNGLLYSH